MRKAIITSTLLATLLCAAPLSVAAAQTDGITAVTEPQPSVKVKKGGVELDVPEGMNCTFYIYSITGQLVQTVKLTSASEVIDLPQGCYIVKCKQWSKKVIVR